MAFSVTGTITIADVRDGAPGAPGAAANFYKNVYLYAQGTSAPNAPSNTAGFNSSTGEASAVTGWSTTISSVTQGNTIWIADARLVQTGGTGSWSNDSGWSVNAAGYSSADGSDAPRFAERKLYTDPAVSTTPSAPSATITWSTGALSSITSGWSETPPTQVATSTDKVYESTLVFIDTTPPFSSTTVTGTSPRLGVNFSGLVTFDSGAFAVDGSTITNIDGGNIQTGTISANELTINIRSDIGAGTGNGNGNGNSNLTNANVAIGGTQITSGTVSTGRLPSEAINKNDQYNLVDPRNWDVGTDAGDGFGRTYSFNENDANANERIVGEDAFGTESIIWQTIPDSGNDSDGGWNCDFEIYKTTDTLLYVNYVKRITTQSSGSYYLGCHGSSTLNLSGTANTNPYFVAAGVSELPVGVWCAVVGVIYGSSSTKTTNDPIGGVYRLDTGQKIRSTTSYRMKTNVTLQRHRAYLYYSSDNATRLQFCKPGVYVVNGSEPTLGQILGPVAAINNSSNTIDGSSITSNTVTANQLVNNIRVDIGAGTGNGNGNGNGNSNLTNTNVSINAAKVNDFTSTVQTTNINGGYINTGVVAGGNLSINSTNFEPNAGQGFALGTSGGTGRLVVGDTNQYMWWNGSALTIQGSISNLTQTRLDGLAGSWQVIEDDTADLTNTIAFKEGAGLYRCIMVGGGGGGGRTSCASGFGHAAGGGASGIAFWTLDWDGTTALSCTIGTGGSPTNTPVNVSSGSGGSSTFSVAGSTRITVNGGGGQLAVGNNRVGNVPGGTGGNAVLTSAHSSISDTTFRSGGAGGSVNRSQSENTNVQARAGGGGGVDFFGNGVSTRGGQALQASNNVGNRMFGMAAAGGGPFGPGADPLFTAFNTSEDCIASSGASSISAGLITNQSAESQVTTPGGTNVLGPYLGSVPPGISVGYSQGNGGTNTANIFQTYTSAGGITGGGAVATNIYQNAPWGAQDGGLFAGGGGIASPRTSATGVVAGNGGLGAGGGGAAGGVSRNGGYGGGGALFILKL